MTQAITIVSDSHLAALLEQYAAACKSGREAIDRGDFEAVFAHIDIRNDKANAIALWLEVLISEQRATLREVA